MIKRLPKVFESGNERKIIIINLKNAIKKVVKSVLNDICCLNVHAVGSRYTTKV